MLLGVSAESVRKWHLAGCPRKDDGTFVVAEVVTWLRARDVETALAKLKSEAKPLTEMNRKLAVEADLKELQLAQLRGGTILVEVHDEQVGRIVGGFAAVAKGQLSRFERDIVRTTTAPDARKLTDRIHAALMEGAQSLADDLDHEAANLTQDAVA